MRMKFNMTFTCAFFFILLLSICYHRLSHSHGGPPHNDMQLIQKELTAYPIYFSQNQTKKQKELDITQGSKIKEKAAPQKKVLKANKENDKKFEETL